MRPTCTLRLCGERALPPADATTQKYSAVPITTTAWSVRRILSRGGCQKR
jgi:hypothetical protein